MDEKDVAETPKEETTETQKVEGTANVIFIFPVIVLLVIILGPLVYLYTSYRTQTDNNITATAINRTISELSITNITDITANNTIQIPRKHIRVQPNCLSLEHIQNTLKEIWIELRFKKFMCTPEDFNDIKKHVVPNLASNNNKVVEPRSHFVIYIAVGLLLTSLVAAFLDVYKVRGKPSKSKPQLTKRCSLADLTVLRHSRRESMRRDSMMDEHRGPLKLLDNISIPE